MRINELVHSSKNTPESNLLTALEVIRNRYKNQDQIPKINTKSLINLVLNTDKTFDYQSLVNANESNPAVKNLIKSLDQDYIELHPVGDEPSEEVPLDDMPPPSPEPLPQPAMDATPTADPNMGAVEQPVDVVDDMAKRAAAKRGAPLF